MSTPPPQGQPIRLAVSLTVPGAATQELVAEEAPGSSVAPAGVCARL